MTTMSRIFAVTVVALITAGLALVLTGNPWGWFAYAAAGVLLGGQSLEIYLHRTYPHEEQS